MDDVLHANVARLSTRVEGFDVLIVCTSSECQARFWQSRLEQGAGSVIPPSTKVICVFEDWAPCGAGNGLGTLYAWQKAVVSAEATGAFKEIGGLDAALQSRSISAAIYHTAGKGTRLAPLPGSENNNKPGVKLPACVALKGDDSVPITILEAVIRQTGAYAASRKGRLSVFWGDQVFVPSAVIDYEPTHLVDILCTLGPMPSAEEWARKGLHKYGLIATNASGDAAQVEKVDHATATRLLKGLGEVIQVGTSLGSFSVSHEVLNALTIEFSSELAAKEAALDTDPHFWMPMTLEKQSYLELMEQKGDPVAKSSAHFERIAGMISTLPSVASSDKLKLFAAVDVGTNAYWWDYGQCKLYCDNNIKLTHESAEADAMRQFLGVSRGASVGSVDVDGSSCLTGCHIKSGKIRGSALAAVAAQSVDAEGAIIVNVTAKKIRAAVGSIAYNVVDESEELVLGEGEIVTEVFQEDGTRFRQKSEMKIDGKDAWKSPVCGNKFSFNEVYEQNVSTDISKCDELSRAAHKALRATL